MNNQLKSKTRLTFIQIIFQHIVTKNDPIKIFESFDLNYKNTYIENFENKKKIKFEFNSNYLKKLINFYNNYLLSSDYLNKINKNLKFSREFKKWDSINKSIMLAALCEINYSEKPKIKIILNDYLNVSKLFINKSDISIINAIIDKIVYAKEN